MVTLNSVLENVMQLDYASREILLDILQERQTEVRRDVIATNANQSLQDYNTNKPLPLSANDIIDKLNKL